MFLFKQVFPRTNPCGQPAIKVHASAHCRAGAGSFAKQPGESRIGLALRSDRAARADDVGERVGEGRTGQGGRPTQRRSTRPGRALPAVKLLEIPTAKVGVGPRPATCRVESLNAARKAVGLDPNLPSAQEVL